MSKKQSSGDGLRPRGRVRRHSATSTQEFPAKCSFLGRGCFPWETTLSLLRPRGPRSGCGHAPGAQHVLRAGRQSRQRATTHGCLQSASEQAQQRGQDYVQGRALAGSPRVCALVADIQCSVSQEGPVGKQPQWLSSAMGPGCEGVTGRGRPCSQCRGRSTEAPMEQACCRPSEAPSLSPRPPLASSPRTHSALGSGHVCGRVY